MSLAQRQSIVADLRTLPLGRIVTDFLDYLVVEAGLSDNTVLAYGRDLREFLRFCRDNRIEKIEEVKPWVVRKYFGPRATAETTGLKKIGAANPQSEILSPRASIRGCNLQFVSENSAKRALVAIRMFLRFAKLRRLLEDDGSEVLDTPKTWQRLPAVCNKQQVLRLLEAPSAEETFYLRDKALLELLSALVTNRSAPVAYRDLEIGQEVRRACGHVSECDGPHVASLLRHPPAQRRG
jgi:integrase/recombinase XerD